MNRIHILDCTLRDGGYINHFRFGFSSIRKMIKRLSQASIDIIECGFLKSGVKDKDLSLYGSVEEITQVIEEKNKNSMYVAMIQYGAISPEEISPYDASSIDGIRLTFHEHEIEGAFALGKIIMEKGYQLFMQPVGTATYTDASLLALIERINLLSPFAFYLVDTLGTMYRKDLIRMVHLIDHNLDPQILLGFHSHNNLQLSFSNALDLISIPTERQLIIDSSVFGLGRGAGNLCTELITRYINENYGFCYDTLPILEIMDEQIQPLKIKYQWGYDGAYYLASVTGCHPNYAAWLLDRQSLRIPDINAILMGLPDEKKSLFDQQYIQKSYFQYMEHHIQDEPTLKILREMIQGRKVLVLAPGKSIKKQKEIICKFIETEHPFVISVQFFPVDFPTDLIFCSNGRRFHKLLHAMAEKKNRSIPFIVTSNLLEEPSDEIMVINYASYLNEEPDIQDNGGLMCLNLLNKIGADKITLAGFDGFRMNQEKNYCQSSLYINVEQEHLKKMNKAVKNKIAQIQKQVSLTFLTSSMYLS